MQDLGLAIGHAFLPHVPISTSITNGPANASSATAAAVIAVLRGSSQNGRQDCRTEARNSAIARVVSLSLIGAMTESGVWAV
jgi:hypothetical protein